MRSWTNLIAVTTIAAAAGLALPANAASTPARPHDAAPSSRTADAVPHDTTYSTARPQVAACDSIFCPGYAMIGVGF